MQRLGFCKAALVYSPKAHNSRQMAEVLRDALYANSYAIRFDQGLKDWLRRNDTNDREQARGSDLETSLQLLYVHGHPSKTGWLSRLAFNEYAEYLPLALGLLTQACDLTDYGAVLLYGLMSQEEQQAFQAPSEHNPLMLSTAQRIFFLQRLVEADGDFLLPFSNELLRTFGSSRISYLDAGSRVPAVIGKVIDTFTSSVFTQNDREQLARMRNMKERIDGEIQRHVEREGAGSRREQTTVPRLEWLVDLGFMDRLESRSWQFTRLGLNTLGSLCQLYEDTRRGRFPENVLPTLIDSGFYGAVAEGFNGNRSASITEEQVLKFIQPSYRALSGLTGYSLLRPLVLHANCARISASGSRFLEYKVAAASLPNIYQSDPSKVS